MNAFLNACFIMTIKFGSTYLSGETAQNGIDCPQDGPLFTSTLIMPGETEPLTDPYDIRDRLEHAVASSQRRCRCAFWYRREGNLSVDPIIGKSTEVMFWIAVIFSNSLGTAFGSQRRNGDFFAVICFRRRVLDFHF